MSVKIGINGFGRIGRNFFRATKQLGLDFDFVAVNDLGDAATMAHLLKYDSVHGRYPGEVSVGGSGLVIDGDELRVLAERNPADPQVVKVTEANLTYVAIDRDGKPRPIPAG